MPRRTAPITAWICILSMLTLLVPPVAMAKSKTGRVIVYSTTVGAEILIDGNVIGKVPFETPIELPTGEHFVEVRRRGYTPYAQVVDIRSGKTQELEIDLLAVDGILVVNTKGLEDAQVVVDGEIIGATPFDGLVAAGQHSVEVRAEGYRPFVQTLSVRAAEQIALNIDLQPLPRTGPSLTPIEGARRTASVQPEDEEEVWETWWFWTIIGVGVAGATTAGLVLGLDSSDSSSPRGPDVNTVIDVPAFGN